MRGGRCTPLECILILLLVVTSKIEGLQKFFALPQYTEVNPGQDALLICRIQDKQGTCSWQKDNKPVGTYNGKYEWAKTSTASNDECSLWVRAATLQLDDGQWQCQVTASSYDIQDALSSPPAALVVRSAPQAPRILFNGAQVMPGENITMPAGSRGSVVCEARYGNPPSSLSWFLDNERLIAWSQTNASEVEKPRLWASRSVLELSAARAVHRKKLVCQATHASYLEGFKETFAYLDITFQPVVSIQGTESGLGSLEEGISALSLECRAEANPPPYVWWAMNDQVIQTTGSNLLLAPLSRNNSGIYSCQARNSVGVATPAKIQIDVKYAPKVIWVGPDMVIEANLFSKVSLECKAEGNPEPSYQWHHKPIGAPYDVDRMAIVSNEPTYTIANVSYKHQGQYFCQVSNQIGLKHLKHQADPMLLNVIGPPLGIEEGGAEAWMGQEATIAVDVCADPPPIKASWLWGSLKLNVPSQIGRYRSVDPVKRGGCFRFMLYIEETTKQDARIYLLHVENERGHTNHAVSLTLHEAVSYTTPVIGVVLIVAALAVLIICLIRHCRHRKEAVAYKSSELETEKPQRLPADAIYSTKMYSPDALKDQNVRSNREAKEHIYSIVEPRIQYDLTISKPGSPATFLTISKPLNSSFSSKHRRSNRSNKQRPKSLQNFESPQYLDHIFPQTIEI